MISLKKIAFIAALIVAPAIPFVLHKEYVEADKYIHNPSSSQAYAFKGFLNKEKYFFFSEGYFKEGCIAISEISNFDLETLMNLDFRTLTIDQNCDGTVDEEILQSKLYHYSTNSKESDMWNRFCTFNRLYEFGQLGTDFWRAYDNWNSYGSRGYTANQEIEICRDNFDLDSCLLPRSIDHCHYGWVPYHRYDLSYLQSHNMLSGSQQEYVRIRNNAKKRQDHPIENGLWSNPKEFCEDFNLHLGELGFTRIID